MEENENGNAQRFLELIRRSRRGKFKIYIGMIAGVGKTYRMLSEAHDLLKNGIDVQIGYVETHGRPGTVAMLEGLPVIPRKKVFYKGKEIEEMDLETILQVHPELVIVDELAHTNVEGSRNTKRWEDVMELLDAGINVVSALNIQHIESLSEDVKSITGINVAERVPDKVLQEADEVVNIDLTAEDLITRLKAGNIYKKEKIQTALNNFFKTENILQLRELALKEVAFRVERKVESEVTPLAPTQTRREKILACVSSNEHTPRHIIRKAYRLSTRYSTSFIALHVQTPKESPDRIKLSSQRYLLNYFQLVTELGGKVEQMSSPNVTDAIVQFCKENQVTTVCMGRPAFEMPEMFFKIGRYKRFLQQLSEMRIDLIIVVFVGDESANTDSNRTGQPGSRAGNEPCIDMDYDYRWHLYLHRFVDSV